VIDLFNFYYLKQIEVNYVKCFIIIINNNNFYILMLIENVIKIDYFFRYFAAFNAFNAG